MSMDKPVWVYCVRCKMPCQAMVHDSHDVEWYVTCDCEWQRDDVVTTKDETGKGIMEDLARQQHAQRDVDFDLFYKEEDEINASRTLGCKE